MNPKQILALNDKAVIKKLKKELGYTAKELATLRESTLEERFHLLSKYFEELKDYKIPVEHLPVK